MLKPAKVICADPAWLFDDSLPGEGRGASDHYECMSAIDIGATELPPIADDALLFLWRVAALQDEALHVMSAWGFELKTEMVWVKLTPTMQRIHFGMGHYVRASHETCLIGVRGNPEILDKSVRSVIIAPTPRKALEGGTWHSAKPPEFYNCVERLSAGPYAEMFCRTSRPGWDCYGLELEGGRVLGAQGE